MPKECNPDQLRSTAALITEKVNGLVVGAQKKFGIFNFDMPNEGFVQDFTRLEVQMTSTEAFVETWRDDTTVLFYTTIGFFAIVLLAFCVVPGLFVCCAKKNDMPVTEP